MSVIETAKGISGFFFYQALMLQAEALIYPFDVAPI